MATDTLALARTIVDLVGGASNIGNVSHCVTRLRFKLRDQSLAKTDELAALDDVLQVVEVSDQLQVVIGPHVYEVYDAVIQVGSLFDSYEDEDRHADAPQEIRDARHQGISGLLIDLISSIMAPIIGVLASTMMLKGLLALWDFLAVWLTGTSVTETGAYVVLYAIADGFMCFLPVILGFTAARRFKMNNLIGAALGAALCYSSITALSAETYGGGEGVRYLFEGTIAQMPYVATFFGIPLVTPATTGGYTATFLPVIVSCWASSKIFHWANRAMPATIKLFAVPMVTLAVGGMLTFLVIGPVTMLFINLVGLGLSALVTVHGAGSVLTGALLGAIWQILVIFGFHYAVFPIILGNLNTYGYEFATPGQFGCTWAQIACVLVVLLKTRDTELRNTGIAAFITGIFGTTEPAIYGVTLPLRLPFVFSCIGGAASGAFYGLMGNKVFMMGYSGLLGLTAYIDVRTPEQIAAWEGTSMYLPPQGIFHVAVAACGVVIAFAVGFVLTWLFWRPEET